MKEDDKQAWKDMKIDEAGKEDSVALSIDVAGQRPNVKPDR